MAGKMQVSAVRSIMKVQIIVRCETQFYRTGVLANSARKKIRC